MTPAFRLWVAFPLIGLLAWLSACVRDPDSPLRASDARPGDLYGSAVALSRDGNTLAVGAELKAAGLTAEGVPAAGAVYVYSRTAQGWREQARLWATVPVTGSGFGHSLSLSDDGSRLAVGAPFESHNTESAGAGADGDQGAVYVFDRSDSGWALQSRLLASRARSFDWFGMSVSLSSRGDTVAVGAHRPDGFEARQRTAGSVYMFVNQGGQWRQRARLQASNAEMGDACGSARALSGDGRQLAVGARLEDSTGSWRIWGFSLGAPMQNSGAVHLYSRS